MKRFKKVAIGHRRSVAWRAVAAGGIIAGGLFTVSALTNAAHAATFGPDTFMDIGGSIQKDATPAAAGWSNAGVATTGSPCTNGGVHIGGSTGLFDCGAAVGSAANPFPVTNQTPKFDTSLGNTNDVFQSTFIIDQTGSSVTRCPSGLTTGANQFGGGEKFTDDPSSDSYSLGPVQDKDQIGDVYAVARQNSQGADEVYVGLERLVNNGDTHADFQFLQEPVAETTPCSGQFTGGVHEQGDVVLEINFDTGGGSPSANLLLWSCAGDLKAADQPPVGTACRGTNPVAPYKNATWMIEPACGVGVTSICYDPAAVQIATNGSGSTACGAWICRDTSGNSVASLPSNDFMEGAVNLDGLGINTGCAATFFPLTRSAGSGVSSQISSFAPPTKFHTCADTTTTTAPSAAKAALGTGVTDSATVSRAFGTGAPTGHVAFYACGPYKTKPAIDPVCTPTSSNATSLGTVSTAASTTSTSATFTSPTPGFAGPSVGWYCFDAEYTPISGNRLEPSNDQSVQAETECFQVTPLTPAMDTTISPPTHTWVGNSWGDSATVHGTSPYGAPTGRVTWTLCQEDPDGTPCTTGGQTLGSSNAVVSGLDATATLPAADAALPTAVGTWCFNATFTSTAANYSGASADPECFSVGPAPSSTGTTVHASSVTLSATGQLTDNVTVSGNTTAGVPGGTVTFYVCQTATTSTFTPGPCADTGTPEDSKVSLGSDGTTSSSGFTPTGAGTWCFSADYSGGGNYQASTDNTSDSNADHAECVLIKAAKTSTATVVYDSGGHPYPAGGEVASVTTYDTATIGQTIDGIPPTGTVEYEFFTNGNCEGPPSTTSTGTLTSGKVPNSVSNISSTPGSYSYQATYSGDDNYLTSTGTCESFIVLAPESVSALKSESPSDPAIVGLGATITYTITLSNTGAVAADNVAVTDDVPGGTTYVPSSADNAGTEADGTVSWKVDIPAADNNGPGTLTLHFQVTVDSTDANGLDIPNTASFTNTNTPNCDTSTCPTNTVHEKVEFPVVTGVKSSDPADGSDVSPGQHITYTITLTNSGLLPAEGVVVTDSVPDGTTFVSASNGSQPSSGLVTWTIDVSPGTPVSVSFVVSVNTGDTNGEVIPNTAGFTNENTPECKTETCSTNTVKQTVVFPVVTGQKSSSPADGSTVTPGQDITYTLTFTNSGLAGATGVAVTDSVPAGTTFVSADHGGTDTNGLVSWTIDVSPGTPVSVGFVVSVNTDDTNGEVIPNTAGFTNEHTPGCSDATCPTNTVKQTVAFPVIAGSKSSQPADGAVVRPGDTITYTVTLTNSGLAGASNEVVADAVPAGTTFRSAADGGVFNDAMVTWTIPTVPAGQSVSVSFTVTVNSGDTNGQVITNVATFANVDTPGCDARTCPTNQVHQTVEFPVVSATKSSVPADGSIVAPGDQITYTVTLSNAGLANQTDEPVSDTVPTGTTFVSAADGGTLSGNTVSWTVPNVPAGGATVSVSFTVSVDQGDSNGQVIPNVAHYGSAGDSTNTVQQTVEFPVVAATKSQNPATGSTVRRGDTITYTITLTNSGLADASNEPVADAVPAGTTFTSATAGGTEADGMVTWTVADVPAGGSATVSFSVTVDQNDTNGQVIPNVAQYTCSSGTCATNAVTADVFVPQTAPKQATTTTTTIPPTTTTAPKQSALAFTGANVFRTLGGGILLGATGVALVVTSRRRRRDEA